ncbi:hypothetical protein Raf01_96940 [Rugosimonospora africana]|uniref:Uncharacterized protein n=1 Tax=Rugosimonospora africana TaxID=556532 RepID=A0A8J3VW95_9ACTN|nr:hypothetical protein Raf01_96940 [Rugosimonospora africana]
MSEPHARPRCLVVRVGRLRIDVPGSLGYFGGIGAAVAFGVIEPPLGLFIAAVPLLKMLHRRSLPTPVRFVSEILQGAAQPVDGKAEGTIRLSDPEASAARDVETADSAERGEQIKRGQAVPARA